ncbi:hypothetical protein JYT51_02415, partial [Candidatus Amoebophilus asiaticus]|nr:hypothetical protein [Candidatus Amoebophilus asiaticus]
MGKLDDAYNSIYRVLNPLELIYSTSTSAEIREIAQTKHSELNSYLHDISLNEPLFHKIKDYAETADANSLQGERKRFLDQILRK